MVYSWVHDGGENDRLWLVVPELGNVLGGWFVLVLLTLLALRFSE